MKTSKQLLKAALAGGVAPAALVAFAPAMSAQAQENPAAASSAKAPAVAMAQAPNAQPDPSSRSPDPALDDPDTASTGDEASDEEIVVTGTFLRGIAPQSATTASLSEEQIKATGGTNADQVLRAIPQLVNFNTVSSVGTNAPVFATNRPNVRNLLEGSTRSMSLILVDGHRVVGSGLNSPSPDPDIVPPGVLERVEVVLDGGASLYGSDAVGGVINFITRSSYDGLLADVRYGLADAYSAFDANLTLGKKWSTGNAFVSFNYARTDEITGLDRDYYKSIDWTTELPTGRECAAANVFVSTRSYAFPGLQRNTANTCDPTDQRDIVPDTKRYTVMLGASQELSKGIEASVRAYRMDRTVKSSPGPLTGNVTVNPTAFFYRNLTGSDAGATQSVRFNYEPVAGDNAKGDVSHLDQWGIAPSLTIDLPADWQMRGLANFEESVTEWRLNQVNTVLQSQYALGKTADTAIDPYNIAATPNRQLISNILDWQRYGYGKADLANYRAVFDGPLMTLPGGEVRMAVGGEYLKEGFSRRTGFTVRNGENSIPLDSYKRSAQAYFGELSIPLVGSGNAFPGVQSLTLALSARHDAYSDVGKTTNPQVGLTYKPLDWVRLRANWGTSFVAPSLTDFMFVNNLGIVSAVNAPVPPGGSPPPVGSVMFDMTGAVDDLKPQTGESYSFGAEIKPPFIPGLTVSATYYNIKFVDFLSAPSTLSNEVLFRDFPQYITIFPTREQIAAFIALADLGKEAASLYLAPGATQVYALQFRLVQNLGGLKQDGIDANIHYERDFGFGSIDLNLFGNYQLSRSRSAGGPLPFVPFNLEERNRFNMAATAGLTIEDFRAQARLSHRGGYRVTPSTVLFQDKVKAYNVVDLFFKYTLPERLGADRIALTLNVNNVFDTDPPIYKQNGGIGHANGSTLGRLVQFGISAEF